MAVSLTLLTLHVVLVLLTDAIANHPGRLALDKTSITRSLRLTPDGPSSRSPTILRHVPKTRQEPWHQQEKLDRKGDEFMEDFDWKESKLEGPVAVCGDDMCRCSADYADCSSHHGNLTYIPRLPPGIKFLNFSHNRLRAIEDPQFFANVTNRISGLSLSDNQLSFISPDAAVTGMANLTELYLGFNYLSYNALYFILLPESSGLTLERLDIRGGNLGPLPLDAFLAAPLPRLKALNLYGNHLLTLNMTAFTPLKKLEYLALENNHIDEVIPDLMPALRVLNLRHNRIPGDFLKTCSGGKSLFPSLQRLNLAFNYFTGLPSTVCLPRLGSLDLSTNLISAIPQDTFSQQRFPLLTYLKLDNLILLTTGKIEENAFRNANLRCLSLKVNMINFGDPKLSAGAFAGLSNLTALYLDDNNFISISEVKFKQLFGNLTSLQTLSLKGAYLQQLEAGMLNTLPHLRKLNLFDNLLNDNLPSGTFDNLTSLEDLDLGSNFISMVTESTFGPDMRERLLRLDLSDNPFNCSSGLLWFCKWMRNSPDVFNQSASGYQCANKPDTDVTSICSSEIKPASDPWW